MTTRAREKVGQYLAVLILGTLLAACGGDGDGDGDSAESTNTGDTATVAGIGQKGPFQPGGTATATRLADDGTDTADEVSATIDDNGAFELPGLDWSGSTEIALEGTFFDETNGVFSSSERRLEAIVLASDSVDANVNLFTHLLAARIRSLLADGTAGADAISQAQGELESLLGISTAPSRLDLLDAAANPDENDGASLLLFSAAVLEAGLTQQDLDDLAADFGDDGAINGAGQTAYEAIQQAGADDTLLDQARASLQNQYGQTPPQPAADGGFAWILDPCTALTLTEPRVVCDDLAFVGNSQDDSGEFVSFVPARTGHYTIELFDDPDASNANTGTCSYAVYSDASTSASTLGDSGAAGRFCGVEDVTELRLTGERTYYIRPVVAKDDDTGPAARFRLSVNRVAEGRESATSAIALTIDQNYEGAVGTLIGTSDESFYRFTAGAGTHRVTLSDYICGFGQLELDLFAEADGFGFKNRIENASEPDACSQTIETDLTAGQEYYLTVSNRLDTPKRTSFRPAPAGIGFDLRVEIP